MQKKNTLVESGYEQTLNKLLLSAPDNFVIKNALATCLEHVMSHNHILCPVSGGADSDVMVDMLIRCGAKDKTDFVFIDTGIEYEATKEHLGYLEEKCGITIKRVKAKKPIPICVKTYGVPFWSKDISERIFYLQHHGFRWEDEDYDTLIKRYPGCKSPLRWWCDKTEMWGISRTRGLKEFMMRNPPQFDISHKCCVYSKKNVAKDIIKSGNYDMSCVGIRRAEGGVRAAIKNCFSENEDGCDIFRPVFWLRDSDKNEYCKHYNITHSRCYSEYGFKRTGCAGCPFNKRFESDLETLKAFEPALYKAANNIFGASYEYTRRYLKFREQKKEVSNN